MTEQDNDVFEEAGPSSSDRDPKQTPASPNTTNQIYKTDDQIMQEKYEQQTAQIYAGHRNHLSPEVKAWVKRQ